ICAVPVDFPHKLAVKLTRRPTVSLIMIKSAAAAIEPVQTAEPGTYPDIAVAVFLQTQHSVGLQTAFIRGFQVMSNDLLSFGVKQVQAIFGPDPDEAITTAQKTQN